MSLSIQLDLRGAPVLVVGAGAVALRKVQQLLAQEARVTILAPVFASALAALPVRRIAKQYETGDALGYWLVYAATDDEALNEQIMREVRMMHCLGASASAAPSASVSFMRQTQAANCQLALSSNGLALTQTKAMLTDCETLLQKRYEPLLSCLARLKKACGAARYRKLRHLFQEQPLWKLQLWEGMLKQGSVDVYVFHGVADEAFLSTFFRSFLRHCAKRRLSCVCLASKRVLQQCAKRGIEVLSFAELTFFLQVCRALVHPRFALCMVQQKGYYAKLYQQCEALGAIVPFWLKEAVLQEYIIRRQRQHPDTLCLFVAHHPFTALQAGCAKRNAIALHLQGTLPMPSVKRLCLIPVFMGTGYHVRQDLFYGTNSIAARYRALGYTVVEGGSLLEDPWIWEQLRIKEPSAKSGQ